MKEVAYQLPRLPYLVDHIINSFMSGFWIGYRHRTHHFSCCHRFNIAQPENIHRWLCPTFSQSFWKTGWLVPSTNPLPTSILASLGSSPTVTSWTGGGCLLISPLLRDQVWTMALTPVYVSSLLRMRWSDCNGTQTWQRLLPGNN